LNRINKAVLLFIFYCIFQTAGFLSPVAAELHSEDLTDLSLEALMDISVHAASRFEQKTYEAPSSVSVISSDEIKRYGYRTLADILRSIRGFYVTYDRNYHYIGVRGFSRPGDFNSKVLLLIDGHRINDSIFDQDPIGTDFPLDIDLIDRIEVIRGPGSSLYGSNAFFATINIITKKTLDIIEASASASDFDTYTGRITLGRRLSEATDILLSGTMMGSRGRNLYYREFDTPEQNNGLAEEADYDRSGSFFGRLRYHDLSIEGSYISRTKGIPTAAYETIFNDKDSRTTDRRGFIDLRFNRLFIEKTLNVAARLFYDYYSYDGYYPYDFGTPSTGTNRSINRDIAEGQQLAGELLLSRKFFGSHTVSAGFEARYNLKIYQHNYYDSPGHEEFVDSRNSSVWALYMQDEFHILDNLILNAGLRHDHYSTFGGSTNPRIALLYEPLSGSAFKLIYGSAFRAPNAYELYFESKESGEKSNPDLKPEKIRTYELVYEQYLGKNIKAAVSGFIYRIKDLISQTLDTTDSMLVYRNSDEIRTKGIELELEGRLWNRLHGRISYTYQRAIDGSSGKIISNSPQHLAKLNILAALLKDRLFAGIEEQYTGRRVTLQGNRTREALITNITIFGKNIIKGAELSGSIYNLFNSRYSDPGAGQHTQDEIRQDGRNFRIKLTYAF